jgi:hypothetical protein
VPTKTTLSLNAITQRYHSRRQSSLPGQIAAAYHDTTCNSQGTADPMNASTKFDMYLAPPSRAGFAALDDWMQAEIADIGKAANLRGNLAVGQVCGITLAMAPAGREIATVLRLRGMTVLSASDYDVMARVGMTAVGG